MVGIFARRILNIVPLLLLAISWYMLAPTALGGRSSYVIVNGNSMEPGYHRGDLVIVAQASTYNVGDVVTYWDDQLRAFVIHRITGIDQDRYILKGDNNSWYDLARPSQSEIVGKEWVLLPEFGNYVLWLREPFNTALVVAIFGGGFLFTMITTPDQKQTFRNKSKSNPIRGFEVALYALSIFAFSFLALTIFFFARPSTISNKPIPFTETGIFSYTATGSPNVYEGGIVHSGEPVFLKMTCELNLSYNFMLTGADLQAVTGTHYFTAEVVLDEKSGWQRSIPMTQKLPYTGTSFTNLAMLDLCQISQMLKNIGSETGFRSNSYQINIISHVSTKGIIAGLPFDDAFEQQLGFVLTDNQLYLKENKPSSFSSAQTKSISDPTVIPNTINIFGIKFPLIIFRIISILGLLASLGGLLKLGNYYDKLSKFGQATIIKMKYGPLIIDASISGMDKASIVLDIKSIEDLVKIANRQSSVIIHLFRDSTHYYLVEHEGTVYRYSFSVNKVPGQSVNNSSEKPAPKQNL